MNGDDEDDGWEYVEEGPAEIIWKGNEIIVKKKKVRVPKKDGNRPRIREVIPVQKQILNALMRSCGKSGIPGVLGYLTGC